MRCTRCGDARRSQAKHTLRRTVACWTFVATIDVDACAGCGDRNVPLATILEFERAIAGQLARRGPVSGETFRWMRKSVGLSPVEVARLLGVSHDTVARWEAGARSTEFAAWLVLATVTLDEIDGPTALAPRIEALSAPPAGPQTIEIAFSKPASSDVGRRDESLGSPLRVTNRA